MNLIKLDQRVVNCLIIIDNRKLFKINQKEIRRKHKENSQKCNQDKEILNHLKMKNIDLKLIISRRGKKMLK